MVNKYEPIEVVGPDGDDVAMELRPDGEWMSYAEHEAVVTKLLEFLKPAYPMVKEIACRNELYRRACEIAGRTE